MRPAENIGKMIKNINIETNAKTDQAVLGDIAKAFEESKKNKSVIIQPSIWRIIMKSKVTKLAIVALIVIAVLIAISQYGGSIGGTSVVWADVVKNTEQARAFTYRERETQKYGGKTRESERQCYFSTEYGFRMDNYKNGQIAISTFTLPVEKALIGIVHPMKTYSRKSLPETEIAGYQQVGPKYIVKLFTSVEYKELGCKIINGVEAEGIEVRDPSVGRMNFPVTSFVGRLWVDVETSYPVLLESEIVGDHNGPIEIKTVTDNFQWDIELDASVFEPNIPADYTLMK
jgi:outer membrane lipoprotein-sorting protein